MLGAPTARRRVQFTVTGCLPVRLRAPSLNARDGLVAVEELGLVYEQLESARPARRSASRSGLASASRSGLGRGLGRSVSASACRPASPPVPVYALGVSAGFG